MNSINTSDASRNWKPGEPMVSQPERAYRSVATTLRQRLEVDFEGLAGSASVDCIAEGISGAALGDVATLGLPANLPRGLVCAAIVTDVDTVAIRLTNVTRAAIPAQTLTFALRIDR